MKPLAAGTALAISAAPAMPAAAAMSGSETAGGVSVFAGRAGYQYPARPSAASWSPGGVQRGRPVRRAPHPQVSTDPADVSRDDLGLPQRRHAPGQHAREELVILSTRTTACSPGPRSCWA